jgi:hypothetical protein
METSNGKARLMKRKRVKYGSGKKRKMIVLRLPPELIEKIDLGARRRLLTRVGYITQVLEENII